MTIQEEVKQLVHRVLKKDRERPTLPPPVAEEEIDAFEARTGLMVPEELREWLRFSNGPRLGAGGIFGIGTPDDFDDIEARSPPGWLDKRWIPIASDGCGSYFVLATRPEDGPGHPVYFLDHECQVDENQWNATYVCASDLWHFLRFYLREDLGDESWPFDRGKVLADDPALAHFIGVPRPWEVN
jgi:cell wall assembly regulator SMI1